MRTELLVPLLLNHFWEVMPSDLVFPLPQARAESPSAFPDFFSTSILSHVAFMSRGFAECQ